MQPLILIVGVAGSGKTHLGKELARQIPHAAFIIKDTIQDGFSTTERTGDIYSMISGPTFEALVNFADLQLQLGKIPIIDCPFSNNHNRKDKYKEWVKPFRLIADKHHTTLLIIRCKPLDEEEHKKRLHSRGRIYDKEKLADWNTWVKKEPVHFPIAHDNVIEITTDRPANIIAEEIIKTYLNNPDLR